MAFVFAAIVLALVVLVFAPGLPSVKGKRGEARVARRLRRINQDSCRVFNDLLIQTSGTSAQIDHVVVSRGGIFVIETKNYSGWIHGSDRSEYWTQTIYSWKNRFRNPVKQNWAHVYTLKEVLKDFGPLPFHPIVVFAGSGELMNVYSRIPVIYPEDLLRTIDYASVEPVLSTEQMRQVAHRIEAVSIRGRKERRQHAARVRQLIIDREYNEAAMICPRCGGALVVRDGRYGKFYGCSSYPNCRYTAPFSY